MLAFRGYLRDYAGSDGFCALKEDAAQVKAALSAIRYCVTINGLKVRVRKYEGETDYSAEVESTFEKFRQGAVRDYRTKTNPASGMSYVEAQILDCVARLFPEAFASLHAFCDRHSHSLDETIRTFDREIQFYVAYLEFVARFREAGLPFCYPEITTAREVDDYEGFDIALANRLVPENLSVVCNDSYLEGRERVIVVSGPNQGARPPLPAPLGSCTTWQASVAPSPAEGPGSSSVTACSRTLRRSRTSRTCAASYRMT